MTLGELIALARDLKNMSMRQLEKESGVSNPQISMIESGKTKDPGFSVVVRLCRALDLSIEKAADTIKSTD